VLQSACNSGRVFHSVLPPIAIVTARIDCSQDFRRAVSGTGGGGLSSATMSASLEAVKLLQKSDCPNLSMSTTWSNTQLPVLSWGSRRRQSAARVLRSRLSIFMQQLQGCWIKQTKGNQQVAEQTRGSKQTATHLPQQRGLTQMIQQSEACKIEVA